MEVEFMTDTTYRPAVAAESHAAAPDQQHHQRSCMPGCWILFSCPQDANGILFIHFPMWNWRRHALARSTMTVKRSLNELEDAGLILRVRQGFGEPNKIYVLIPKKEDSRL